jgi:hypothetical protein
MHQQWDWPSTLTKETGAGNLDWRTTVANTFLMHPDITPDWVRRPLSPVADISRRTISRRKHSER